METIITLLQENPSVAFSAIVAAIVFVRFAVYPFILWLQSIFTAIQAIVKANSDGQRSGDAITNKALDIIAESSIQTAGALSELKDIARRQSEDITHIRHTTDRHYAEFRSSDIEKRLSAIEGDTKLIKADAKLIKQGVIYIAKHSIQKEKTA